MPRKRERFERSDVPVASTTRSVVGAVVCVVVLAAAALVGYLAWTRATAESRLGDHDLQDALSSQASAVVPDGGYAAASDEIECVLLLTTSGFDEGATLESARILAINTTQGTATLATLPVETGVGDAADAQTISSLYSSQGADEAVPAISSAANVSLAHVIVATEDALDEAASLAGSSASELVRSASGLLSKMKTDLDAEGLLSLAETLSSIGVANLATVDAPLVAETTTDEEGNTVETGRQIIDRVQLDLALGLLVPAA